ncbi:hypothetical protein, unlikely [Trypanosoma congolense IL3000]|uniref:Uncharacterized protein n=1 Tax=Trypanosoma congolense (strain IL3000) TaxID=1068625 RepID=F9WFX2_TRYCI|nr:conserved hypothetical protein [Trypanosoma congolense IL3000]CCD16202.1 hypothetical protein, unlikely [Trypanosoma congolense IL3000]
MKNLIITSTFNPPSFLIVGSPLNEETLRRMEEGIPTVLSTGVSRSQKTSRFMNRDSSNSWAMELSQHFCDELHRAAVALVIIESVTSEGWVLRSSSSSEDSESGKCRITLFFVRA